MTVELGKKDHCNRENIQTIRSANIPVRQKEAFAFRKE